MGYASWDAQDWTTYSVSNITSRSSVGGKNGIFSESKMTDELNPKNITIRESRDSDNHPNSTPIIICPDVSGSMSPVLRALATTLGKLIDEIYDKKPVEDPQVCFMAVGDADYDDAPLQVTQFESDITIAKSLQKIYFEQGGGGNDHESYTLPWYFALNKVSADAIEKHGKKGFIFTIGDEAMPDKITPAQIKKVFGESIQEEITTEELLNAVSKNWEVFHLVIKQGNFYSGRYRDHDGPRKIEESWGAMLGQNVLYVSDYNKIPEIIVSTLQTMAGVDTDTIIGSWDGNTGMVVREAIGGLTASKETNGLVEF